MLAPSRTDVCLHAMAEMQPQSHKYHKTYVMDINHILFSCGTFTDRETDEFYVLRTILHLMVMT